MQDSRMRRHSWQIMPEDIGLDGQKRLMNSTVTVAGAGGPGTPMLAHLAAMGVGHIRVVDRDTMELTNLHRQTPYTERDIGRPTRSGRQPAGSETPTRGRTSAPCRCP